ncbi:MAG TPA: type VI secretion system tube protein Hcp [Burkholderiaceae bacterium]|nr:type VI secretion system tube protein Hcp [Burkholderiaceae bacterium]HMX10127.1 type VI secretion system tube protein Hcp [Burkholderiaceae bacterium]HMY98636.1 type VI secretion system tube protein Hcp [Burkholderiaceae bacterium]HNB43526.1 type VI secretion system tube protein Hcp [Burkholderiaceae bacterium]HNG78655.1 type VI secretion system tube protein Hcp [Burkholderiaceae bacterium]
MSLLNTYLKIEGSRQGPIKGDAVEAGHVGEIDLVGWNWGMDASSASFSAGAVNTTLRQMVLRKRTDRASTALMAALRNNELLKKVTLTGRKVGGEAPLDFLKIVMEKARITSHRIGTPSDLAPEYIEEFTVSFLKVGVTYVPQSATGGSTGATTFETEITPQ